MSSGTLYASFKFCIECPTKEDFDFALDLCDTDELSNRICEYEEDEGVEVKALQEEGVSPLGSGVHHITLRLYNTEVRGEIDDVINELQAKLKTRGMTLDGYIQYETDDGEHIRGDFSLGGDKIDYESTDWFLGYSNKQLRELQSIARQKWGQPDKL